MRTVEQIQNTPVIQLSINELRMLPEDDLSTALGMLFDMAKDGDLTMLAYNPPGTTYRVALDRQKGWSLEPACSCKNEQRFVEAYCDFHATDLSPHQGTRADK